MFKPLHQNIKGSFQALARFHGNNLTDSFCKFKRRIGNTSNISPNLKDSEGLSLISTLWIITILSVLAMQILYSFDLESKARNNFMDRVKYHFAAKSGFEIGLMTLRIDETNFDSLGESWVQPIQEQIEDGIQLGRMLNYQVTITDEASKINLNTAEVDTVRNLLLLSGYEQENDETGDLATRIVEGRPFRTVRDVARIEGMTEQILYGIQPPQATSGSPDEPPQVELSEVPQTTQITPSSGGLITIATVYSTDNNTDSNGQARTNVNTANAQQMAQIQGNNNQNVFSQNEANAIIQAREFDGISDLLDVPAVSNQVFNNIRERITIEENNQDNGDGRGNQQGGGDQQININTADTDELEDLQGIDDAIAERIVAHRDSQGNFQNIEAIRDVRVLTMQEFASIVDKITISADNTVPGLININTAPLAIMQLLPGMDSQKAQALITRREEENTEEQNNAENPVQGNPFDNLAQVLDIEEIDDQTFREVVDWITYRSHGYRVESTGIDPSGKIMATCVGIVVRTENQMQIPYWRVD